MFKQQLDEKSYRDKRRITLQEVSDATGISRATLSRIANTPGYNTSTDHIDLLCDYLECELSDLLKRVAN
ncbi:TPA: helix-turn-helix transcriptional regulator [Pseudomonas aeruginosa]|nr:helix-turn-helix transcriptional regulator [Pseudomonas aeruginosa]EIU2649048.1 helix-turn-helix transcriptional regulator [Pseudomonas aeruginosa]EIU2689090.1 helix-turn-helix transcriptional regulator [Pseudomonas aeruginosa]EIU3127617.1 helix-turn-helix transcriptional regulator [Pseudomonas aeruginosa]EKT8385035.1 helix-turn-helix transcriptional regulator [Pseudomonas aeruginosa]EKT9077042.1 helix-turn-helix transcriptional regulator [Pseudomonas aeruginosa]